jgi:N-acetylmuramic acid 6-phosphate etherase
MQATTALMLAIGLPLLSQPDDISQSLAQFKHYLAGIDYSQLIGFIEYEAAVYQRAEYMLYPTTPECAMTVLTDTTERAPTFNLAAFDSRAEAQATASWVYLCLPMAHDARKAWELLLSRKPKALNWPEFAVTDSAYLYGFDFSQQIKVWRAEKLGTQPQHALNIYPYQQGFIWQLGPHKAQFGYGHLPLLLQQLALKVLLNNHSTLVFGRIGFYEGNLMTSLSPSNYKLLDRAIRYVGYLWQQQGGAALNYHQLADCVLAELPGLLPAESIVHKSLARLAHSVK